MDKKSKTKNICLLHVVFFLISKFPAFLQGVGLLFSSGKMETADDVSVISESTEQSSPTTHAKVDAMRLHPFVSEESHLLRPEVRLRNSLK
jgi:hypothetical protein